MSNSILIFSEISSSRLAYTCRQVFDRQLGIKAFITIDYEEFKAWQGAKILYTEHADDEVLHIAPAALLFENTINRQPISTCMYKGLQVPFATGSTHFPFDPFAAIFYLISRYEEYLPFKKNKYGQFPAVDSLACQLGFLEQPVADIWINDLKEKLLALYPELNFQQKSTQITFTYDIDVAFAFLGRTLTVTAGNLVKDLLGFNIKKIKHRLLVLAKKQPDPFDTYQHILQQQQRNGHQLLFFFLLGEKNDFNHNIHPGKKVLQQLIQRLSKTTTIGIHPSYYADTDYTLLQREKALLELISKKNIEYSRQHYLRLSFPVTYRHLMQAGITQDFTMGFAELPGFRAGTCSEFYFYDLLEDKETELLLHPVTFMEGTFTEDMQLSPEAALIKMKQLADSVKKVNGQLISIWHNHSLSDQNEWKGMKAVHDAIAAYVKQ